MRGRSPQLCSAHPDVVRFSVEAARRAFDADPTRLLFSISPNDGYGFCTDARCRAVDALYGVTDGSFSLQVKVNSGGSVDYLGDERHLDVTDPASMKEGLDAVSLPNFVRAAEGALGGAGPWRGRPLARRTRPARGPGSPSP